MSADHWKKSTFKLTMQFPRSSTAIDKFTLHNSNNNVTQFWISMWSWFDPIMQKWNATNCNFFLLNDNEFLILIWLATQINTWNKFAHLCVLYYTAHGGENPAEWGTSIVEHSNVTVLCVQFSFQQLEFNINIL